MLAQINYIQRAYCKVIHSSKTISYVGHAKCLLFSRNAQLCNTALLYIINTEAEYDAEFFLFIALNKENEYSETLLLFNL